MGRIARHFPLAVLIALSPVLASAQATWQPTPQPTITAENEPWYRSSEPIMWSDDYFYQAGATVHFSRYHMLRSGSYRGIPLYIDTTQDPYGIVYVPLANGLMQPYERRRTGQLAGTSGNRAASFPSSTAAEGYVEHFPAPVAMNAPPPSPESEVVATTGRSIVEATRAAPASVARPKGINGVWITYEGQQWFAAGKAVRLDGEFTQAGSYRDFPVYRRPHDERIYLPTAEGMVAPYLPRATGAKPKG